MAASGASGASFFEGFNDVGQTNPGDDGPANLIAAGWTFSNQSEPRGSRSWYGHHSEPYEGTHWLAADYASTAWAPEGSTISNWAILPPIPGQEAGDVMSFFVTGGLGSKTDRVQVRYSPSGGTDTGSGAEDVGDFTEVLLDWESEMFAPNPWQEQRITLPGPGRIAFRYYKQNAWNRTYLLGIDALTIGTPPPGEIPLPQPGETVVWDASISPVVIEGRVHIPAGGTVVVEPGVVIQVTWGSTLVVHGTLRGAGTAESPITVTAETLSPPALEARGTVELSHALIGGPVRPHSGSTLLFANTTFNAYGWVTTSYDTSPVVPPYIQVERSRFENVSFFVDQATAVLRDVHFQGDASALSWNGYARLERVTLDGGAISLKQDYQPVYVDDITVRNSAEGGLQLGGGNWGNDYLIGPSVVLENNQYPISLSAAGLLPGSVVPSTGNVRNAVHSAGVDARGPFTWADVGIPYEIPSYWSTGGSWRVLPGVTVRVGPGVMIDEAGGLSARGTKEAPIMFERVDPAQAWQAIRTPGRLEHVVVDGSTHGLINRQDRAGYVDSAILRNNDRAISGAAIVRGTQFLGNAVGAHVAWPVDLNGSTNPNSFVGNDLAVSAANDARFNWWGHPSGPTSPNNPGGTGDEAAAGVPVIPFLTAPPDRSDGPPAVRLHTPAFFMEPGETVAIQWDASDDGAITRQRILFAGTVVADLPGTQRTFEWTVPEVGFDVDTSIRIEAIDDAGQVGWDAFTPTLPAGLLTADITITTELGGHYLAGTRVDVCYAMSEWDVRASTIQGFLFLDGDRRVVPFGGQAARPGDDCVPGGITMPFVTTDSARVGVLLQGNRNDVKWAFSEPFGIHVDPRIGDAAPTVTLLSPMAGQMFEAGDVVPVRWAASDDEGIRGFLVLASYDGGRTWHTVAEDLPASGTGFDWRTPAGNGLGAVELRVVAKDLRFQSSSAAVGILVGPGDPPPPPDPDPDPDPPPPETDTVQITRAEYDSRKGQLRVEARGSDASAALTVYVASSGQRIGTLSGSNGRYKGQFNLPSNPERITVRSNLGGSDTRDVQLK